MTTMVCQRQSPVVEIKDVRVHYQSFGISGEWLSDGGLLGLGVASGEGPKLVTVKITGEAFLYRQVRNMVGCLFHVGTNQIGPNIVPDLLAQKDRSQCPPMAPAHGLFLVDVKHGDFII